MNWKRYLLMIVVSILCWIVVRSFVGNDNDVVFAYVAGGVASMLVEAASAIGKGL